MSWSPLTLSHYARSIFSFFHLSGIIKVIQYNHYFGKILNVAFSLFVTEIYHSVIIWFLFRSHLHHWIFISRLFIYLLFFGQLGPTHIIHWILNTMRSMESKKHVTCKYLIYMGQLKIIFGALPNVLSHIVYTVHAQLFETRPVSLECK